MGMNLILLALSNKRREALEREPDLFDDVLDAREEEVIAGLLDLGKTWDALDFMLSDRGKDKVLGDALLARGGTKSRVGTPFGKARIVAPERVVEVSKALDALEKTTVRTQYERLHGTPIHGNYGQEKTTPSDSKYLKERVAETRAREIVELEAAVEKLKAFYQAAAKAGQAVLSAVV